MKLLDLTILGFGRFVDRRFSFGPGLVVVYGPNEAGKSTLSAAVVAALYGVGRDRERWRPWSGTRYGATLHYALDDGREFEVQRDFDRDPKGVHVYDRGGNDVTATTAYRRNVSPGFIHLGVPLEVFVNAACVRQGAVRIEGARAEVIGASLTRALDGGPRDDAALGALARLDRAIADHVGSKRATVNAPLRALQRRLAETTARAAEVRAALHALADLRSIVDERTVRATSLAHRLRDHEQRTRNIHAAATRDRLEALRKIRADTAALIAERSAYDDVATFDRTQVSPFESQCTRWQTLASLADADAAEALSRRLTIAEQSELDERKLDGGALDDGTFARLRTLAQSAQRERDVATKAAGAAAGARRIADGGATLLGAAGTAAALFCVAAILLAVLHAWPPAVVAAAIAAICAALTVRGIARRRTAAVAATARQSEADAATAAEREAALDVAEILEPLHVTSLDELERRRHRHRELALARETAVRAAARAAESRRSAAEAARLLDAMGDQLALLAGTPPERVLEAKRREARRGVRDGIDISLEMLRVQRDNVLGNDAELALERELAELLADGAVPAALEGVSRRAFDAQRTELERAAREAAAAASAAAAELRAASAQAGDLAALDEAAGALEQQCVKLEAFERAVGLARATIEERAREAHQKFARRLEDYSVGAFLRLTDGRYADLRVDPTTLAVRVRVPESGAIHDLERLSTGTREQAFLIVRLAMARMFAEGSEVLPLLLDDPFAFWDAARLGRGMPLLLTAAQQEQVVVFSASDAFATAAAAAGAQRIDLSLVESGAPA